MKRLPEKISEDTKKMYPGTDFETVEKVAKLWNKKILSYEVPFYLYVKSGVKSFSRELDLPERYVFRSLNTMANIFPDQIKFSAIFERSDENIFMILDPEDIEEIRTEGYLRDPESPMHTKYLDPIIRYAFVLARKNRR